MLNSSEKLAVVEIAAYIPIALVAFYVSLRYACTNRRKAWIFLLTFAMIRSVKAILTLVFQHVSNPPTGLLTAVKVLPIPGPSLLLLATHALISPLTKKVLASFPRFLQLVRVAIAAGMILSIIGGIRQAPDLSESAIKTGRILFKIGTAFLAASYLAIFGVLMLLWIKRGDLSIIFYKFLRNISIAMPFLAARVVYSLLVAFNLANSILSTSSSKRQILSLVALLMEFIVACIHLISGITIPLNEKAGSSEQAFTRTREPLQEMSSKP